MCILNYFSRVKPIDRGVFVPRVSQASSSLSSEAIVAANREIEKGQTTAAGCKSWQTYSSTQRAKMGKYAAIHRPVAASRHFSASCEHKVRESTVFDIYIARNSNVRNAKR